MGPLVQICAILGEEKVHSAGSPDRKAERELVVFNGLNVGLVEGDEAFCQGIAQRVRRVLKIQEGVFSNGRIGEGR